MNIVWYSNTISGRYGYSVLTSPVTETLQKDHQIIVYGMQSLHPPFKDGLGRVHVGLRYDAWGADILENILRSYKADLLITAFDVWLQQAQYIPPITKKLGILLMTHVTANSYPLSPFLATFLSQVNFIICPSKFVYNTVKEVFSGTIFHIPHGVDLNTYKPLPEEEKRKMKEKLKVEDKEFIVLSVMRNKGMQKDFPTLFYAWKSLLEKIPKLREKGMLLCLTDPFEPDGMRVDILRDRIGMTNNIRFVCLKPTKDFSTIEATFEGDPQGFVHNANYNFSAEEMTRLYNIADCHVISSLGESFNLPTLEAMACGIPVISGNHTTGLELVGESKAGLLANVKTTTTTPLISDIFHVDQNSLMECMKKIYEDENFRKECSKNGLEFAKKYSWDLVTEKWKNLVNVVEYLR